MNNGRSYLNELTVGQILDMIKNPDYKKQHKYIVVENGVMWIDWKGGKRNE